MRAQETDSDNDGVPDCIDLCPDDPDKVDPGACECDTPDTDSDNDGTPDCNDVCPGGDDDVDVDLDGVPDDCQALVEAFACPGLFDGIELAMGESGTVFMLVRSPNDSTPGLLHLVTRDGTSDLNVNVDLPEGSVSIAGSDSGGVYVLGTPGNPNEHVIDELDATSGDTLGRTFETAALFLVDGLTFDFDEQALVGEVGGDSAIYRAHDGALVEFATGLGGNTHLAFHVVGEIVIVADGTELGLAAEGSETAVIWTFANPIMGLARDNSGSIYVLETCESCPPETASWLHRFGPAGGDHTLLWASEDVLTAMAIDTLNDELVVYGEDIK